ncbi:type I restriction enzyme R subunit [Streptococcus gallinaceus]|uniref:type I restriction endonuclease subunit R n=1 Tax=Streptococcus gallinaceus TaxID=165758 RepID=UPI00209F93B2|nr:type I restriction endonuclease [Streptococcus gallinaceus]MCP1638574.1 type I restriction enzyme R subunit [Streptococcus gallinaceus]MCP1769339.1 type I restriction enzyme R subunit [Streptococcus gallinaceus]
MAIETKEINFEQAIEEYLLSTKEYKKGYPKDFNRELALDTQAVIDFVKTTQADKWALMTKRHGKNVEQAFIKRLVAELDKRGMLDALRKGIMDLGVHVKLAYFKPGSNMNKELTSLYEKNNLQITRQVKYSMNNENSIDIVILLNGLPIVTIELKNPLTGQTYKNAISQYQNDRNPKELLLSFKKRALVHFSVDPDEVWMTTKLAKLDTLFLPFNRGYKNGAGNPPVVGDYKTSYLWREVLRKDSLLDIIQRFIQIKKNERTNKEVLIFPRYHQLNVVRYLIDDVYKNGSGHNYLIQHSAGSGKSNSIAWLAHHLENLHDENDEIIFNSIIVITDRKVLDKQLQRDIYNMDHTSGVVVKVDKNAKQLTDSLEKGDRIIICTLQKFPFVDVNRVATNGKRFAIIVDEAHSSQSGKASEKLKEVLADISQKGDAVIEEKLHQFALEEAKIEDSELDADEELAEEIKREIATHGNQKNLSFFAFTATPKQKTLEIFGSRDESGKPIPCHIYSMKQAIEEGFIFDVLANYTTYTTYFQLGKKVADDPEYAKNQANKALGKYMSLHPHNLAQKTEIIIEHFRNHVRSKIGGKAKAMLVTGSRLHAVRYYFEFERYIKSKGYNDLGILVAFSGVVKDGGVEYTEEGLNKFPESELVEKFDSVEYQLLLVAEKYQTGFDQPLVHTMYVDKKLSGVKAVQTLSRINRTCAGKVDTFVLDFVNTKEDIQKAFEDYYVSTTVEETTDPNTIYEFKDYLDGFMIYSEKEVNEFSKIFFKSKKKQSNIDLGILNSVLDPVVERYNDIEEKEEQQDFKYVLMKFVRLYAFLTHIINLQDESLHKFYVFAKGLVRKIPKEEGERVPDIASDVNLQYYRIQKEYEGSIKLSAEAGSLNNPTSGTGIPVEEEKEKLSEIIKNINERLGTNFTEMDKVLEQIVADAANNKELVLRAKNPLDLFKIIYKENIMDIVLERMTQNQDFALRYLEDEEFRNEVDRILLPLLHERLSKL